MTGNLENRHELEVNVGSESVERIKKEGRREKREEKRGRGRGREKTPARDSTFNNGLEI